MKRLLLLLNALFLFSMQAVEAQKLPIKWEEKPINGVSKAWLRLYYFYAPRVFPHQDLPPNLWLDAWNKAEQMDVTRPDDKNNGIGVQGINDWEFFGPSTTNNGWLARTNAIVVDRTNGNNLYIGVAKGGVWKSTDAGTTWANLTDTITQYVGCLTQDPVNANTFYVGTGEEYFAINSPGGVGIYKTTDGGATWTLKGSSTFSGFRVNAIVIDPGNTNKWVVSSDRGIYVTTDGGTTFTQKRAGIASALRMHPTNASILYAAIGSPWGDAANNGIYKSTDGGNTWAKLAGGLPASSAMGRMELDIHKANPNVVYVAITQAFNVSNDPGLHSLWKTTDGGTTWTQLATPPSLANRQGWYDLFIRADPTNASIAYFGMVDAYKTTNGGTSWTLLNLNHTDQHTLEFHPTTPTTVYLGQDSGIYVSTDGGTNWTHKNANRGTMEYYAFDVHPTDPNKLFGGAQDNSTHVRTTGNSFNVVIGGDGFWTAYKKSDPNIMLGEAQRGWINRSTNAGVNWSVALDLGGAEGGRSGWSTPLINDPTNNARFYAGSYRLWRSNTDGASGSWAAISGDLTGGATLSYIAVAPSNGNVVYTGSEDGKLFVTTNATAATPTFTNRTAGLPNASIGGIVVDPANANTVYVSLMGFGINHVMKSTNAGANWTNYSGNLPDISVNDLVINPVNTAQLLAATDIGVFLTSDGTTWTKYGLGLPNTPCTHLRGNATTGFLTVSTYGRGMWRIALPGGNPVPAITSLSPNTKPNGSAAFTLTVNGSNFLNTSKVRWNGTDRTTTFVSAAQLTASITAADVATAGTANVTVFNPTPGGGTSNTLTFTITGSNTLPVAGLAGATITFDGVNDIATVAHTAALNPFPLTVSCWIKTTQNNGNRSGVINKYVAASGNGWQLYLVGGKVAAYYFRDGGNFVYGDDAFSTPVLSDGNWHHVALTVDAASGKLYLDGALVKTQAWTGTAGAPTTTQALRLGIYDTAFAGQLDEVKIWNVARTATQVLYDVNASLYGDEAGLVAYYRMNEGTGSTVADATGHGNTMTLTGSPVWAASTATVNAIHVLPAEEKPTILSAFDAELNPLTYSIVATPTKGTIAGTLPQVVYNAGVNYYGADLFTYRVNDGTGNSNTATVNINYGMPFVNFLGTTTGGLIYNRTSEGTPPTTLSGVGTAVRYTVLKLTVPVTGSYNLVVSRISANYDSFVTLYNGSFDSANPLVNSIIANDDRPNTDFSGFDNVALTAGNTYYVVVSGYDNNQVGDFNLSVMGPGVATITQTRVIAGTVTLADSPGKAFSATFLLHPSDNSGDITRTVNVSAAGAYTLTALPAKNYQVRVKSSNTLARVLTANVTAANIINLNFAALLGGDANNDNSVDVLDLAMLIEKFDKCLGDAGYSALPDFNRDDCIDVLDLDILIRNFDLAGDEI